MTYPSCLRTLLLAASLCAASAAEPPRGLVAVVGCDDPAAVVDHAGPGTIVHALDRTTAAVAAVVERARRASLLGPVSAETWAGDRLPYVDNLVSELIVRPGVTLAEAEALRVLRPGGVARLGGTTLTKPWPQDIDGWPQYLYDATGQSMSKDRVVGPPRHIQWIGDPKWTRAHESYSSFGACVSAAGRMFYIVDLCPVSSTTLPPQFTLVARDAFNGVVLWQRPLDKWLTQHFPWKQGPYHLLRLLVATERELYAPVGIDGDLAAFDTATGTELRRYPGAQAPEELVLAGDTLLVVANPKPPDYDAAIDRWNQVRLANTNYDGASGKVPLFNTGPKRLLAFGPDGRERWRLESVVLPLTLASDHTVCVFHDGAALRCVDLATGSPRWSTPRRMLTSITTAVPPSLAITQGHVVLQYDGKVTVFRLADGAPAWDQPGSKSDYGAPASLFFLDGLVWTSELANAKSLSKLIGHDPATGTVRATAQRPVKTVFGHARCHRSKSTEQTIITGTTGVEFCDPRANTWADHNWMRGACTYGIMPANGLLYVPPTSCACNPEEKVNGLNVFAPTRPQPPSASEPLEAGPALAAIAGTGTPLPAADAWPMYRHDAQRSNRATVPMPERYARTWSTPLGGLLTPPVAAEGLVLVSRRQANEVVCLDQATGAVRWRFATGAPVDSAPTISGGKVFFGGTDGHVYALRLADGVLAWRYRVAPGLDRIIAHERLESSWPVHGSVVVQDGAVFAVAGRSSFLDGGLRLVRLDAERGTLIYTQTIATDPVAINAAKQPYSTGALNDLLVAADGKLLLRQLAINPATGATAVNQTANHLMSSGTFLDQEWHHRHFWSYGRLTATKGFIGYGRWHQVGNTTISGRLLAFDGDSVYGFGRNFYAGANSRQFVTGEADGLFRTPIDQTWKPKDQHEKVPGKPQDALVVDDGSGTAPKGKSKDWSKENRITHDWMAPTTGDPTALIAAQRQDGTPMLLVCSPTGDSKNDLAARLGRTGCVLRAHDAITGTVLADSDLGPAVPVFDGLIAAQGRLFISGMDGAVYGCTGR